MIVLDASVAAKWFIVENDSPAALSVLDGVVRRPADFVVPELFFVEMLSVLARAQSDTAVLQGHLKDLEDLGLTRLAHGHEMLVEAAALAHRYQLSGYDGVYAACAKLLAGVWLTSDERAHRKLAASRLSKLLS